MKGLKGIVNPPTMALVTALLFSSLPLGRAVLSGDPLEGPILLRCLAEIARPVLDVIRTIAMAGIALQAIVLGAAFSFDASKTGITPLFSDTLHTLHLRYRGVKITIFLDSEHDG